MEVPVDWKIYGFILVSARDVEAIQDGQTMEIAKVLEESTPKLSDAMPRLQAKSEYKQPRPLDRVRIKPYQQRGVIKAYSLGGPDCPKGGLKKGLVEEILDLISSQFRLRSENELRKSHAVFPLQV